MQAGVRPCGDLRRAPRPPSTAVANLATRLDEKADQAHNAQAVPDATDGTAMARPWLASSASPSSRCSRWPGCSAATPRRPPPRRSTCRLLKPKPAPVVAPVAEPITRRSRRRRAARDDDHGPRRRLGRPRRPRPAAAHGPSRRAAARARLARRVGRLRGGQAGLQDVLDAAGSELARIGDNGPVCIYGESAGAHLALVAAERLRAIDCVIGLGTPTDLPLYTRRPPPASTPA